MKKLRITFKNQQYADFEFVDNIIGEMIHHRFERTPKELLQKPVIHSHSFGNLQEVDAELRALVEKCTNVYNIDMPHIPAYLDVKTFNRVHEQFHVIDEQFTDNDLEDEFAKTLGDLNNIIHTYEHSMFSTSYHGDYMVVDFNSVPSKGFYNVAFDPVDSRHRELFKYSHPTSVSLKVGYNTVGKNMYHVVQNNDVELVKKGLVRPQVSISNQTVISIMNNQNHIDISDEEQHQCWLEELEKFVVDNSLQPYIGYKDIMHTHTIQPNYANIIDNENNNSLNWTELCGVVSIDRFELI